MQKRSIIRRSTIIPTAVMAPYWRETLDLIATDLSPKGMYLITDTMPKVGEFVFCTFAIKGNEPEYRLLSRVKRINWHRRRTDHIRPGFGVEFLAVDDDQYRRISDSLIGIPPPIPSCNRPRQVSVSAVTDAPFRLSAPKQIAS